MKSENQSFIQKANNWLKTSISVRVITIGVLILLLLIPVSMVRDLIKERQYRQEDAVKEVSSKWGNKQTIRGLVLTVPYNTYTKVYDKEDKN